MSERKQGSTSALDRIFEDAPAVVVLEPPESALRSPIFDDSEQIAALPDNLEDR